MPPSSFTAADPSRLTLPAGPLRAPPVPGTIPTLRLGASPTPAGPGRTEPPR